MINNTLEPGASPTAFGSHNGGAMNKAERAAEGTKDAANSAIESGRQAVAEARDAMGTDAHSGQDKLGSALDTARDAAANFASSVSGAASYVGQKAEDATSTVGEAIENTVHYLKDDGFSRLASDATNLVRRNPIPAMLIGIGLGFVVSQAYSRRNS